MLDVHGFSAKEAKMKRTKTAVLLSAFLVAILMGSCDALFTNQFQAIGLGQVSAEDLQGADAETLIDASGVNGGQISQSFIDAVLSDEDTKDNVIAALEAEAGSSDPAASQAAEVLITEILIQDSGADQILDNVANVITVFQGAEEGFDPANNPDDMNSLVDALIPPEVQADPDALAEMINTLYGLSDNFDDLGANLAANGGYEDPNMDAGTIAQTAVIAAVLGSLESNNPEYPTLGEAVAAALAPGAGSFDTYIQIEDDGDGDSDTNSLGALADDPNLTAILEAGGLGFLLDLMSGGEG